MQLSIKDYEAILKAAYKSALNSNDPSTQNGAILLDESGDVSNIKVFSFNCFPPLVESLKERWDRPLKYSFIEHAERNAIYEAAKRGIKTKGLTMVCPWSACADCARAIVQSGISRLVRHKQATDRSPEFWLEQIKIADQILKESGVEIIDVDCDLNCGFEVLHSGIKWNP